MKRKQRKGLSRRKTRRGRRAKQRGGAAELPPVEELGGFQFQAEPLSIKFSNGRTADGSVFPQADTVQEPTAMWTTPDPSRFRTLICFDPDAKARSWLHWLVVNATGDSPMSGERFMEWEAPKPPPGTATHRYYFCLFEHSTKVRPDSEPKERGFFDVTLFLKEYGMRPISYAMIKVNAPYHGTRTPNRSNI